MRTLSFKIVVLLLLGIAMGCSSSGDSEDSGNTIALPNPSGNPSQPTSNPPGSFSLTFPNNNEVCQEGAAVADQPNELVINFKWSTSSNASSYELQVIESESGNEVFNSQTSLTNQDVQVTKGTLYKWIVTASNDDGEVSSSEWGFYSKGEGVGNYVPYPAYDIQLTFEQTTDVLNVQWQAADEDEDPLTYDIKVYEDGVEIYSDTDIDVNSITNLPAVFGASYYAIITVKDGINATTTTSIEVIYE